MSVRWIRPQRQHRAVAVKVREQSLEVLDLGQIVVHDVGIGRIERQEILVIVLRPVERSIRLEPRDDGRLVRCLLYTSDAADEL